MCVYTYMYPLKISIPVASQSLWFSNALQLTRAPWPSGSFSSNCWIWGGGHGKPHWFWWKKCRTPYNFIIFPWEYIYIFHQGFQLGYRISSLISTYIYISTIEWFIRENVAGSVECLKPSSIFVGWLLRRWCSMIFHCPKISSQTFNLRVTVSTQCISKPLNHSEFLPSGNLTVCHRSHGPFTSIIDMVIGLFKISKC